MRNPLQDLHGEGFPFMCHREVQHVLTLICFRFLLLVPSFFGRRMVVGVVGDPGDRPPPRHCALRALLSSQLNFTVPFIRLPSKKTYMAVTRNATSPFINPAEIVQTSITLVCVTEQPLAFSFVLEAAVEQQRWYFGVFKVQPHATRLYMCLCCGLFAPTQFRLECCGVLDDSR